MIFFVVLHSIQLYRQRPRLGPSDRFWKITIHIETGANSLVAEWTSTLPGFSPKSRSWSGTAAGGPSEMKIRLLV